MPSCALLARVDPLLRGQQRVLHEAASSVCHTMSKGLGVLDNRLA